MNEFRTFLELTGMLFADPRSIVLFGLLVTAAVIDARSNRIPNWLTLYGTVFGLLYSAFVPFYLHQGFLWSLGGWALGLGLLFPFYLMRVMGAGDVKLMAMSGALLGVTGVQGSILGSLVAGGIVAVGYAIRVGKLREMLRNVAHILHVGGLLALAGVPVGTTTSGWVPIGKLPFGVAIAAGTISSVMATHYGLI